MRMRIRAEGRDEREERRQSEAQQRDQNVQARPAPLDLELTMPLVERALQVLERRNVQPQLGLLKSTMLQLDSAFTESAYGARSFSEFIDKLKRAELVNGQVEFLLRDAVQRRKGKAPQVSAAPRKSGKT